MVERDETELARNLERLNDYLKSILEIYLERAEQIKEDLKELFSRVRGELSLEFSREGKNLEGALSALEFGQMKEEKFLLPALAEESLARLKDFKEQEYEIIADAEKRRYELEHHFSELTQRVKEQSLSAELSAYQSSADSVGKLLGANLKTQALLMIPFEVAEATKEMANFLATKDPSHLAASLKHTLAVKQYAEVAKTSAPASSSGAEAGSGRAFSELAEKPRTEHRARVIVNVGEGIVVNPKEFARQLIEGLNEAYRDNVKIEFA